MRKPTHRQGWQIKLILDELSGYLTVEMVTNAQGKRSPVKSPKLRFIRGQRKSVQLLYSQYAYAKNNEHGPTTYWNCRIRRTGLPPCNARLSTTKLLNGSYKVCLTRPEHNHPPSKRIARMLQDSRV
ncbi:uncharacterized protein LOC26527489 isoform X3 [Drosophila mojavensis]|uniref:FLYWCH-type domain-containing protein n=1 Tax=Drosophila mojavensis TaxID=7230 RepID=A0A0Q9XD16_DROMO|nr:uncharacterized protein LOC26527489 isoform X3 [Drosophila mojavensis]KRG02414.1 uncharacterized protein Dmoj_GI26506 [Drosophila mojavensis]